MTIYALSTGPGISGVAVIRVSGNNAAKVVKKITGSEIATCKSGHSRKIQ